MRIFLLCVAIASSAYGDSCTQWTAVAGTYTNVTVGDVKVISCLTGKINVSTSANPGDSVAFERASCSADGSWYGTSCDGHVYVIDGTAPFFACPEVVLVTTVPTVPTVPTDPTALPTTPPPPPCTCAFENVGASQNMAPPTSLCTNGVNQVLQCDDKIYVKTGDDVAEFDRISCSAGKWFGTGCDGTISPLTTGSVKVQCGKATEPVFCKQLPSRGGLIYVGLVGGMQRYACPDDQVIRFKMPVDGVSTMHTKYFECDSTTIRPVTSNGFLGSIGSNSITEVSCRDYGSLRQSCSIPYTSNSMWGNNELRCNKGYYAVYLGYYDVSGAIQSLNSTATSLSGASCGIDGWSIGGTTITGVQLAYLTCKPSTTASYGSCASLPFTAGNLQYDDTTKTFTCLSKDAEEMKIEMSSASTMYGDTLQCVSGGWKFTGSATVSITASTVNSVYCSPRAASMIPSANFQLIYAGKTSDGLVRWTCPPDYALELDMQSTIGWDHTHAAYIEANQTYYRYTASVATWDNVGSSDPLNSVTCVDMGPMYSACNQPVDFGGIRKGNRYECMKGYYFILWANVDTAEKVVVYYMDPVIEYTYPENYIVFNHYVLDTSGIRCNKDGWQVEGTSATGLRLTAIQCYDAAPEFSYTGCAPAEIQFAPHTLNFDFFRRSYTCYEGETLGYTFNSVKTLATGKKLICGGVEGAFKWQLTDGSTATDVPVGATMDCFT